MITISNYHTGKYLVNTHNPGFHGRAAWPECWVHHCSGGPGGNELAEPELEAGAGAGAGAGAPHCS